MLAEQALREGAGSLIPGGGLDAPRRPLRPRLVQEVRQSECLSSMLPHTPATVLSTTNMKPIKLKLETPRPCDAWGVTKEVPESTA